MRTNRLAWIALGAACASIVAVFAEIAWRSPASDQAWFLVVAEEGQSLHDGPTFASWQGAEIARDCGARSFEISPGVAADASDRTRIPLVRENNPATNCIMERAKEAGLWLSG